MKRAHLVTLITVWTLAVTIVPRAVAQTPSWLGDVPGLGNAAPDPDQPSAAIKLAGCTVTNPMFADDPARIRRFVPSRYELGTNAFFGPRAATINAAVLACDSVRVGRRASARTVLSLIAVQVKPEPADDDPADAAWSLYTRSMLNVLPSSSWYLMTAQTNNRELAARLRRSGLPVDYVAQLAYHADYGSEAKSDSVAFPVHGGSYRLSTTTLLADPFVHNHDWMFWHDSERGARAGFFLHLHGMSDSSCGYWTSPFVSSVRPPCGATLTAPRGSSIANFLGATVRTTAYAFNHPPSHARGYISPTP